jgi:outer membrane biosynthesis protein TonB
MPTMSAAPRSISWLTAGVFAALVVFLLLRTSPAPPGPEDPAGDTLSPVSAQPRPEGASPTDGAGHAPGAGGSSERELGAAEGDPEDLSGASGEQEAPVPSPPAVSDSRAADSSGSEDLREETGDSELLGSLSKEAIGASVLDQLPDILECYQAWLSRNPGIEGRLEVEFVIGADDEDPEVGRVQEIDIADTTIGHIWMEGCVLRVMEDAEFEAPEGGGVVRVSYPFEFSSDED